MGHKLKTFLLIGSLFVLPLGLLASSKISKLGETSSILGIICIVIFCLAYVLVILEEFIHLRKSKPTILAAGLIWIIVGIIAHNKGYDPKLLKAYVKHNLAEYAELFFFLLVAMTYINSMTNRGVFEALRSWLINKKLTFYQLYWITGVIAFFLSPIADNLTTALILGAAVLSVGSDNKKFIGIAFINIVVAANAGGSYSSFGDITTLMVWQAGKAGFFDFFQLFIPAFVNYIVPAIIMSFFVPKERPEPRDEDVTLRRGAKRVCGFFLLTIVIAVTFEQVLHIPPFMGMMTGLSILMLFGYYLKVTSRGRDQGIVFNIFNNIAKSEWDTLMFFFGVIFCVGGLDLIGYLELLSHSAYIEWGATPANISAGVISGLIDNIPVMFAILSMDPQMSQYQWLLITLTAGTGGSLLSVGSAAGVALMGQSKGLYTFFAHLKWSWVIALGYGLSIYMHYLLNS